MVVQNQSDSYTICQTHPFIQWLPNPILLQIFFSVPEKEVELRVGISSECRCGRYKRRGFFSEKATGRGGGHAINYFVVDERGYQ